MVVCVRMRMWGRDKVGGSKDYIPGCGSGSVTWAMRELSEGERAASKPRGCLISLSSALEWRLWCCPEKRLGTGPGLDAASGIWPHLGRGRGAGGDGARRDTGYWILGAADNGARRQRRTWMRGWLGAVPGGDPGGSGCEGHSSPAHYAQRAQPAHSGRATRPRSDPEPPRSVLRVMWPASLTGSRTRTRTWLRARAPCDGERVFGKASGLRVVA